MRVGSELRLDRQAVLDGLGAGLAERPALSLVEQHVLDVLGHQPADEVGACRPLGEPPAPLGHAVLDDRDRVRVEQPLRREVAKDERPCGQ